MDYLDQSMQAPPGRTHRYYTGKPLYPFGFGLGYSRFRYDGLAVSHATLRAEGGQHGETLTVSVTVSNEGQYAAGPSQEVVTPSLSPRVL